MISLICILYISTIIKHRSFWQTNCVRFANVINNATIINIFSSNNSNITKIKTQNLFRKKIISERILKIIPLIKNQYQQTIHSLLLIPKSILIPWSIFSYLSITNFVQFQKNCDHNLAFVCLQFYNHDCLNVFVFINK